MRSSVFLKSKNWLIAMSLLMTCSVFYSCEDNNILDETKPGFLGGSIYSELSSKPEYSTVVKLIDDLGYAEVLDKTGSKTLFVANDEAYNSFFSTTTWLDASGAPVRSYEQLTQAQKKLLFNSSMLDNAYLTEMLTNVSGTALVKNTCLRQPSSLTATDSIAYFTYDQLPKTLSKDTSEVDLWMNYNQKGGIFLALDHTVSPLTHFIAGQMSTANIQGSDFKKIVGQEWTGSDVYMYDTKIIKRDVTCLNGYINFIDKVLITPPNMAELIRTNGKTNLFSRMLDRFSAPVYSATLTDAFEQLRTTRDSVFVKRYYSLNSAGSAAFNPNTTTIAKGSGKAIDMPLLSFDPGWNTYRNSTSAMAEDMGAMFVPNDDVLKAYFLSGGGRALIDNYAIELPVTEANLELNMDQIPLKIVQQLINNLMKASFNETVPSKYLSIKNDARDDMFPLTSYASVQDFESTIDECLLASNGVVYITNQVFTPAAFAAVLAPVLYNKETRIFNEVISADDNYVNGSQYASAPLKQYFSTYLKAMQSHFTLFVPTDDALSCYYDAVSAFRHTNYRFVYDFRYVENRNERDDDKLRVKTVLFNYDPVTGEKGNEIPVRNYANYGMTTAKLVAAQRNALIDMVDQHIVIHDGTINLGTKVNTANREYYFARSGAPIHIKTSGELAVGSEVEGGWQSDFNAANPSSTPQVVKVQSIYDQTQATNGYGNGMTYFVDRPIQATVNSVYAHMEGTKTPYGADFTEFGALCQGFDQEIIAQSGLLDSVADENKAAERNKYRIFIGDDATSQTSTPDFRVRFFRNYNYTVYVPTNAAVLNAIANGLPTWTSIRAYIDANVVAGTDSLAPQHKAIASAMVVCLTNFLKYHFQDRSVFNDKPTFSNTIYETASYKAAEGRFLSLKVTSGGKDQMSITDAGGNVLNVVSPNNVLARDLVFSGSTKAAAYLISSSSYSVLHQIDGYLNFMATSSNTAPRFDTAFTNAEVAAEFVKNFNQSK